MRFYLTLLPTIIACLPIATAYANPESLHNGFFIGFHSGAVMGQFRNHTNSNADLAGNDTSTLLNNYIDSNISPYTGISLGLAGAWERFYIGIVGSANYSRQVYIGKAEVQQTPTPTIVHESEVVAKSSGLAFDISITPGLLIAPSTAIYGIIGITRAKFIVDSQIHYIYQSGSNVDAGQLNAGNSNIRIGKEYGAGFRTSITDKCNIYFEYTFKNYKGLKLTGASTILGAETGDRLTSHSYIRPYTQTFVFGVDINLNNPNDFKK